MERGIGTGCSSGGGGGAVQHLVVTVESHLSGLQYV